MPVRALRLCNLLILQKRIMMLKTMNAREGIKTEGLGLRIRLVLRVKNNECP